MVQDDELLDSDEDTEEKLGNAKELAGMRVRHDADELGEGETMILTLADRNILDEHGEVDEDKDELENALVVCLKSLLLSLHFQHSRAAIEIMRPSPPDQAPVIVSSQMPLPWDRIAVCHWKHSQSGQAGFFSKPASKESRSA